MADDFCQRLLASNPMSYKENFVRLQRYTNVSGYNVKDMIYNLRYPESQFTNMQDPSIHIHENRISEKMFQEKHPD